MTPDENDAPAANGAAPEGTSPEDAGAQPAAHKQAAMRILTQYAKDVSFENPRGPRRGTDPQPRVSVDVEVRPSPAGDSVYEDELRLSFRAVAPPGEGETEEKTIFLGEVVYAALVHVSGLSRDQTEFALLAEVPRQMFPFVRRIVADLSRDGGHPPFFMDPINFLALYERERAKRAGGQAESAVGAGDEAS